MATGYWRGADNATWNTTTNWWTTIGGTTTVATVPGAGETAFFNANGTTTARTVYLNGSRSLGTFWMNGNAQGDITLRGGVSGGETTQTLTLGGIDMSGTSANAIFSSSVNVALANAQSWSIGSGRAILVSGVISGAFKLTSNNAGVIILGNANTYSGGTDISAGTVRAGNNQALGTGTVTMTGGKLSSSSTTSYILANALTLNGTVTLCDATNTGLLTFSSATTIAGTTSLTVAANYVLMQGVFGGTGAFTLASGELDLEGATGTKSGGTTVAGGTLYLGFGKTLPDQLGSDSLTINSGSVYFCGSSNSTIANTITGSGGNLYARPRNAVVTFSNASAYTGILRIFAGASDGAGTTTQGMTLGSFPTSATDFTFINQNTGTAVTQTFKYTGTASPGSVTPLTSSISMVPTVANSVGVWQHSPSNGTATMSIAGWVASNTSVAHTIRFTNDSTGLLSFSGGIDQRGAGVMAVSKTGTGPVSVSGTGTYTGTVSVSAGTFNANSTTALGSASSTAGISVTSGATLSLGGASNITYTAPRTLTLAGSGVGGTAGALVINNAVTNTFSGIALTAGTVIRGSESGTLTAPVTTNNHNLTFTVAAGKTLTLPVTSVISASTSTVSYNTVSGDTGTAVVSAQNLYTNPTVISQGTVRVGASYVGSPGSVTSGPLGRGQLIWNGGALDASTTATLGNNVVLGGDVSFGGTAALTLAGTVSLGASRTITTNGSGGVLTLSGVVSGTGFSLTKAGANTLVLSGANTYSGGTTISGGTLSINADNNLGTAAGSIFIINQAATFKVTSTFTLDPNRAIRLGLTSGSSTGIIEVDSGQTLTISGFIDDNGAGTGILGKTGAGTLFLLANNAYAGGTNIVAGTVRTVAASSLGTGNVSLTSGSSLWVSRDSFFNITRLTVASLDNGQGCTIKIS